MNKSIIEISSFEKIQAIIIELKESLSEIKKIFDDESQNIEKINGIENWKGITQQAIYSKCKKLQKNFPDVEESLEIYIEFLEETLSEYKNAELIISQNLQLNSDKLDIN